MSSQYSTQRSVLLKILLHAAGHPSQSVNGLLIGRVLTQTAVGATDAPGSPRAARQQTGVEILDVLPLFHTYLSLAPMTEVALVQADAHAQSQGLEIVGYYHANERIDDVELGPVARKLADRIHSNQPKACALLVDNSKLTDYLHKEQPDFLQVYVKEGQKGWARAAGALSTADAAAVPQLFLDYFREGRHREVVDFDDHLNDIQKGWFNQTLLE